MKLYDKNFCLKNATNTQIADAYIGYERRMHYLFGAKEGDPVERNIEFLQAERMRNELAQEIQRRFLEIHHSPVNCNLCICPECEGDCMAAGCRKYPLDAPGREEEECDGCFMTICKGYIPKEYYDDMDGGND